MTISLASPSAAPSANLNASRVACLACRAERQRGQLDAPSFKSAVAALQEMNPDLSPTQAGEDVSKAISFASVVHSRWFWEGVAEHTTR